VISLLELYVSKGKETGWALRISEFWQGETEWAYIDKSPCEWLLYLTKSMFVCHVACSDVFMCQWLQI